MTNKDKKIFYIKKKVLWKIISYIFFFFPFGMEDTKQEYRISLLTLEGIASTREVQ